MSNTPSEGFAVRCVVITRSKSQLLYCRWLSLKNLAAGSDWESMANQLFKMQWKILKIWNIVLSRRPGMLLSRGQLFWTFTVKAVIPRWKPLDPGSTPYRDDENSAWSIWRRHTGMRRGNLVDQALKTTFRRPCRLFSAILSPLLVAYLCRTFQS